MEYFPGWQTGIKPKQTLYPVTKKKKSPITLLSLNRLVLKQGTMLNEADFKVKASVFDLKARTVLWRPRR